MSYYLTLGLILALGTLVLSILWSYYSHTGKRNETTLWRILSDAFNLPTKIIVSGPTYFLLIATIALSFAVADGLHERMINAGWDLDIPYVVNVGIQMLGTLAFYLIPLMISLVLDSSLPRIGWTKPNPHSADAAVAKHSKQVIADGHKAQYTVLGLGLSSIITMSVLAYLGIMSTAFAISGSFFTACLTAAIYIAVTGYYFSGTTYIEIMVLLLAVTVGIGVYSLDFYWNKQLTVDFVLNNLDYASLTDLEIEKAVQKANQDYSNRTLLNIILIIVDLFAAAWSLLNKEQLWFVRMQQRLVTEQIGLAAHEEATRLQKATTTPSNKNNNPPPPPPPPPGGGGPNPPPKSGSTI